MRDDDDDDGGGDGRDRRVATREWLFFLISNLFLLPDLHQPAASSVCFLAAGVGGKKEENSS